MPFDLRTIAEHVDGRLDGPADLVIERLCGIERAGAGDLSFIGSAKFAHHLETSTASALIVTEEVECTRPVIRVPNPTLAFNRALHLFSRPRSELFPAGVHPDSTVDPSAQLGEGIHVGARAVIAAGCVVGHGSVIGAGVVLSNGVSVGADCLLYPNASILHDCVLGDRVIVHSGAVVGSDGFGFAREPETVHKIPQVGIVRVGNDVEIGANSCIDRATAGETVIADSVKIDNLVQIAHNCEIGERTAISSQTGISGSTKVGRDVIMAGQVGLADHMSIGDGVVFAARTGAHGHIPEKKILAGAPAQDHRAWIRMNGHMMRLDRYVREIADLKCRIEELEGKNE